MAGDLVVFGLACFRFCCLIAFNSVVLRLLDTCMSIYFGVWSGVYCVLLVLFVLCFVTVFVV